MIEDVIDSTLEGINGNEKIKQLIKKFRKFHKNKS